MLFWLSFFLFFVQSPAAEFCPSFASLKKPVKSCEDNFGLGDAAMNCIEKFESAIKVGQAKLQIALKAKVANMNSQQSGSYNTTDSSYENTKRDLLLLIANGLQAKAAVSEYLSELHFPEDYEQPAVTGMSSEDYLNQEPCFSAPREVIAGSNELIGKMVADLEKTAIAVGFKEKTSESRSTNVGVVKGAAVVGKEKINNSKVPAATPKGKDIRSSDISGTKEKKD
jgi:hypothetical protein